MTSYGQITFPAIRGTMGGKEFYAAMFPLGYVADYLQPEPEDLPVEYRAQRKLMESRIRRLPITSSVTTIGCSVA